MYFIQSVLVVATLAISIVASNGAAISPNTNKNVLSVLANSGHAMAANPSRSFKCFNYYIPRLEELVRHYEVAFAACEERSKNSSLLAEADSSDSRKKLFDLADNSCTSTMVCSHLVTAEKVFECYVKGATLNVNRMKEINDEASDGLFNLREQLYLIKNDEYQCTNESRREYERENSEALTNLDRCIKGEIDAPTITTTTTEAAIVEPEVVPEAPERPIGTESPENSEVPQTESPENSENPEVPEIPENSENTEVPQIPENSENPEVPESSENSENPEDILNSKDFSEESI